MRLRSCSEPLAARPGVMAQPLTIWSRGVPARRTKKRGGAAEICAQPRGPFLPGRQFFRAQGKTDFIADEAQQTFAGGRRHDRRENFHAEFLAGVADWESAKSK